MDSLQLNIRGGTDTPSLPDKQSLPKSPPTASLNANIPTASVDTADTLNAADNISHKPPANNSHVISAAVNSANHFFEQVHRELRFERSDTGGQMVAQVIDQNTGKVLRQFPTEQMLQISKDLEKISGLLFKDSA
jgi:flagellar protein FlaG